MHSHDNITNHSASRKPAIAIDSGLIGRHRHGVIVVEAGKGTGVRSAFRGSLLPHMFCELQAHDVDLQPPATRQA